MKYITEESIKIRKEEQELWKNAEQKRQKWKEAADKANNDEEYEKTRVLFDDALKAHETWHEYFSSMPR